MRAGRGNRCRNRSRVALLLLMLALASPAARAQPADPPDTIAARVLACAPCSGRGPGHTNDDYFPRLSGKPAGYLLHQLIAFRDGRRRYPPMNYLLEYLPDALPAADSGLLRGVAPAAGAAGDLRREPGRAGTRTLAGDGR